VAVGEKVSVDWWTLFRSADLDLVVKQAIDGSPTLAGAKKRLTQARKAIVAASSALYPQASAGRRCQPHARKGQLYPVRAAAE
jgi:outer membrane protein TolC